jgi:hypothetical protein
MVIDIVSVYVIDAVEIDKDYSGRLNSKALESVGRKEEMLEDILEQRLQN